MASLKDMRVRIASTKATQKITKAMQMVAASKLRRAQTAAEAARPYATKMDAVIVRGVNWRIAPFAKLQALPKDGRAVVRWRDRDAAWRDVSEVIERVVEEMRKNQRSRF